MLLEPDRWYEAERLPGDPRVYQVTISGKQMQAPVDLIEERSVPEDAWENLGFGPLPPRGPGQPSVMARTRLECREGHRIQFPPGGKRTGTSTLPCPECGRSYTVTFD
jgi:hypothetical protein